MKRWRKHVTCLLMVTFPVSLWAAAAAPRDCSSHQPVEQVEAANSGHAHHGAPTGLDDSTDVPAGPGLEPDAQSPASNSPCCDTCLSACVASGLSALSLQGAVLEPVIPAMHFKLDRATHFLLGPSYPSLYRPPIAQI